MIKARLSNIPVSPGVYLFRNNKGEIIYVGKAVNLKNRVGSYFNKQPKDTKVRTMLTEAADVSWQEVESEIEALLLEAEKIKAFQPHFNVALRDGKQYSYVVITDDIFPKIYITHQPNAPFSNFELAAVFGPFIDGGSLRVMLKHFRRIFPYCTCKKPHNHYCFNYHIQQCLGFCCLKSPTITDNDHQQYKNNIKAIKDLLYGKRKALVRELEAEMKESAVEENFETAIDLRDKIEKINEVFENARVIKDITNRADASNHFKKILNLDEAPFRIEGYDVANIQGKFGTGSMVVFVNGSPAKSEYKKFRIRFTRTPNDTKMLHEVITRRLNHPEWQWPNLIVIDGGKAQLNTAVQILSEKKMTVPVISLTKDQHHVGHHVFTSKHKRPIPLTRLSKPAKDLILQIDKEAHRFAIGYYRQLHRRSI